MATHQRISGGLPKKPKGDGVSGITAEITHWTERREAKREGKEGEGQGEEIGAGSTSLPRWQHDPNGVKM